MALLRKSRYHDHDQTSMGTIVGRFREWADYCPYSRFCDPCFEMVIHCLDWILGWWRFSTLGPVKSSKTAAVPVCFIFYIDPKTMKMTMKPLLVSLLLSSAAVIVSAQEPPFASCNATDYYAGLLATKPDVSTWTREDIAGLILDTHQRVLPNVAPVQGDDDILVALVDLYPGTVEESVRLVYRDIDFPAVPAGSPNTWKREDLWPIDRGVLRTSSALTDVHSKIPADYTVLFIKSALFFGECGTVEAQGKCKTPATVESASDTESDGKIFAPPVASRGDIARSLFYTELRYQASLGLRLTDCPPFGPSEFGYLSALLEWAAEDKVSDEELARNDRKCSRWQGNRNPFVDYPQLVEQFFGTPNKITPGTVAYDVCQEPTNSPTAVPNACSTLRAGDAPVFLVNSDDPDQIVFYSLASIDADVEYLYVTDNAWNGERFVETEGIMRVSLFVKACKDETCPLGIVGLKLTQPLPWSSPHSLPFLKTALKLVCPLALAPTRHRTTKIGNPSEAKTATLVCQPKGTTSSSTALMPTMYPTSCGDTATTVPGRNLD